MTPAEIAAARNIVNQIGDLFHDRIPSGKWVRVRQETNDQLDAFVAGIIRKQKAEAWGEGFDAGHYVNAEESRDCGCGKNPYREEDE